MLVLSLIRIVSVLLICCFFKGFFLDFQSTLSFSRNGLFYIPNVFWEALNSKDCELWELESEQRAERMASSQVEIVSSSPFGCVLRDHNRSRDRSSNARFAFQKNLKDLVHSCISVTPTNSDSHNSNRPIHNNGPDSWDDRNENKVAKKSKIVDRWAQAREMVFRVDEKQSPEADADADADADNLSMQQGQGGVNFLKSSSSLSSSNGNDLGFTREISPVQSDDCSVEIPNLGGVSSLVRKWRDFQADAKNLNANINNVVNCSSPVSCRSNAGSTFQDNSSFINACDSLDGKSETPTAGAEDLFFDWESDRTAPSGPPSSCGKDSDAAERERIRVADIVKKLSSDTKVPQPLARIRTAADNQQHLELRVFPPVVGSPRLIRGRQAFSNLLMQMERDKQRELEGLAERKAVSRFSHRGRIQAMLRIRFLRHGSEAKSHRRSVSKTLESNRLTIKHLRERFSTEVDRVGAPESHDREVVKDTNQNVENPSTSGSASRAQVEDVANNIRKAKNSTALISNQLTEEPQVRPDSRNRLSIGEVVDNMQRVESSSTSSLKEGTHCEGVSMRKKQNTDQVPNLETRHEVAAESIPDIVCQGTEEPADRVSVKNESEENKNEEEGDANMQQELIIRSDPVWVDEISHSQTIWEEQDTSDRQILENCQDWMSEFSQQRSEWDEQGYYSDQHDWISDIARPRSDWEGLRQARYQEMLDPFSDNGEIRQLLERRSVSSFLSSGLRERIDRLMISRTQGVPIPMDIQVKEQGQELELEQDKEEEQDGSVRVRQMEEDEEEEIHDDNQKKTQGEEENGGENEDEEVRSRIVDTQFNDYEEFIGQTTPSMQPSPSPNRSWGHNEDHEVSDDFDQYASPSLPQSFSSSSYSQNNQTCSSAFMNTPSIEMELIYDLRGHMEQLHQEISELRKSIKSCVDMQIKLQRSIKHEVAASVSQSVRREGKETLNPNERSCLICCQMKVDSLLYRCGHMCTCFKCAHELQWGSGKCPICQSPIVDVVRTQDR